MTRSFDVPGSVKDLIEACGVPHTEVDLVIVNGRSVDFSYLVQDGDVVGVYPVYESFDISPIVRLRPEPLRVTRFVLDNHLGRLARYLRLIGFDTLHDPHRDDPELVRISVDERRILLTRDIGLLKHGAVTHGAFVRATNAREQLVEIVRRFQLSGQLAPYTRCIACNGEMRPVDKSDIAARLPPETRAHYDDFRQCTACGKVYWRGAHHAALERIVEAARTAE